MNPGSIRVNIYGHMVQERGEPGLKPCYGSGVNLALAVIAPGPGAKRVKMVGRAINSGTPDQWRTKMV